MSITIIISNMKRSEARIIIYLNQVDIINKFGRKISIKLEMDYNYTLGILKGMKEKEWIHTHRRNNKVFFDLTEEAPVGEASSLLSTGEAENETK